MCFKQHEQMLNVNKDTIKYYIPRRGKRVYCKNDRFEKILLMESSRKGNPSEMKLF